MLNVRYNNCERHPNGERDNKELDRYKAGVWYESVGNALRSIAFLCVKHQFNVNLETGTNYKLDGYMTTNHPHKCINVVYYFVNSCVVCFLRQTSGWSIFQSVMEISKRLGWMRSVHENTSTLIIYENWACGKVIDRASVGCESLPYDREWWPHMEMSGHIVI